MTHRVDYDVVADGYNQRYETSRYDGVLAALLRFVGDAASLTAAEVGCGTGHWLAEIRDRVRMVAGLDLSMNMLRRARMAAPDAHLVRARTEQLPWTTASIDRLFCVNALHHFDDVDAFIADARRVLRPGGTLLTIGLDPHTGLDQWWVYDYFPSTLDADRARFRPTEDIRRRLTSSGFVGAVTAVTQHLGVDLSFDEAMERGHLDKHSKSQLLLLSEAEYRDGLDRLRAEKPRLRADLRLYATMARRP